MTSKLRRTIVGVGIALGGAAAPGCFGRSHFDADEGAAGAAGDSNHEPDAARPNPLDASTDGPLDASTDGPLDASTDGPIDPFCDVSWPPTKANPTPGTVLCVDPLHECTDAYPPWRCYRMIEPSTCFGEIDREGPLHCIDGEWRCPPGSDDGQGCTFWALPPDGAECADASAGDGTGADGGDAAS